MRIFLGLVLFSLSLFVYSQGDKICKQDGPSSYQCDNSKKEPFNKQQLNSLKDKNEKIQQLKISIQAKKREIAFLKHNQIQENRTQHARIKKFYNNQDRDETVEDVKKKLKDIHIKHSQKLKQVYFQIAQLEKELKRHL